tara:strand:- start:27095 stop:27277 length:183 start_codon:yes stop_codon:yes gene_type:complete
MNEFLEIDELKKTINTLNLDDFSIDDLNIYIIELEKEILRVQDEIQKKRSLKNEAQKYFK